jgi:hypothetical protein
MQKYKLAVSWLPHNAMSAFDELEKFSFNYFDFFQFYWDQWVMKTHDSHNGSCAET